MWIKVCGIRDLATARDISKLRPNAVGLNFYSGTLRHVPFDVACQIVEALSRHVELADKGPTEPIEPVGLFVNHTVGEIIETCDRCRIRTVQLHGDETPSFLAELVAAKPDVRIIRAYRFGADGLLGLSEFLDECNALAVNVAYCLIDARVEGSYGGSGQTVPWGQLHDEYRKNGWPPLILAGGLRPDNVAEAIHAVRPMGVDVASGVESSPGRQDLKLVRQFIDQAREAFAEVASLCE